jgi:hypothetical protein
MLNFLREIVLSVPKCRYTKFCVLILLCGLKMFEIFVQFSRFCYFKSLTLCHSVNVERCLFNLFY